MIQKRRSWVASLVLVGLMPMALSSAEGDPETAVPVAVGQQFQVNAYTTGSQHARPQVAVDGLGRFVVVWPSEGSYGTDNSYRSIQGQIYDFDGTTLGGQFQINTYITGDVQNPWVDFGGSNDFVTVWRSEGSPGDDSSSRSIQGRRYDVTGTPKGAQFQVNTVTSYGQHYPSVGVDSGGKFVVTWAGPEIHGQRFGADGSPLGGQFQVNSYATGYQGTPVLAVHDNGDFLVVWESRGSFGTDSDSFSLQGQRYDAMGMPEGGQFQVNSYTTGNQFNASLAVDASRGFVVAWHSDGSYGNDDSDRSIQLQRFDSVGTPQGGQLQVNTYTTGSQTSPKVAMEGAGEFVVVWHSDGSLGTDLEGFSIQAQGFTADGTPDGDQFQLNTYTTGDQFNPSIAVRGDGPYAVVWRSDGSPGTDTDSWSIQGQRFEMAFFYDGFESGDTSAWSSTVQ